jgi:hypothetical protein
MLAVSRVQVGTLRWLLAKGGNVNSVDSWQRNALFWVGEDLFEANYDGETKIRHSTCLSLLLEGGLHINDRDSSECTALIYAASHLRLNAARILLDQGAFANASDDLGRTPLMAAVCAGLASRPDPTFVRLLCERGADVNLKDVAGRTALDHAEPGPHCEELRAVLLRYSGLCFTS